MGDYFFKQLCKSNFVNKQIEMWNSPLSWLTRYEYEILNVRDSSEVQAVFNLHLEAMITIEFVMNDCGDGGD